METNWQATAHQFAQLRLEELNRMGGEIVALRVDLVVARARIAELEARVASPMETNGGGS